jgi:D-alanine transaminase
MERTVYVNGSFVPESQGQVSIFDRAFLFADGVYEVSAVLRGKLLDNAAHLARLARSLQELDIAAPLDSAGIEAVQQELIERNQLAEGTVYLQVTRGSSERDFAFPKEPKPTLIMFTQARNIIDSPLAKRGISVKTLPDIRWGRRDIKTVQLLAASLAKQTALSDGFDDAWLTDEGFVNEASSANAYIVDDDNTIITRHLSNDILHGITRAAVLQLCAQRGLKIEERSFTVEEAYAAREAFITSASSFVYPVVRIDDHTLSNGAPGPIATDLRQIYIDAALAQTTS